MQKFKRAMAITLAATMVIGSSVTAFAADDGHSSTGTGSNEGHVDKHVISVTLPTVPANSTPFNYTVDPERLVPETSGARYGDITFTENAKRDGVYFLNSTEATDATYAIVDQEAVTAPADGVTYYTKSGDVYTAAENLTVWAADTEYYTQTSAGSAASSSYDNKSGALTATSQSSADVELTVEVAVGNNGSVDLVNAAPSTDGYTAATVADAAAFAEGTYYTKSGTTYTKATEYAANTDYYEVSDPELYLALVVGSDTTVLEAGETATKTVTIAGIDGNFETTYDAENEAYAYTVKNTGLTDWNTSSFYLTGVASKASAENVTVPTLTVTWSYADPAAEEEPAESDEFTVTFNTNGGSDVDAQTVEDGGKATEPAEDPTKDADEDYTYTFAGWYADEELTEAFDFDTEINEDTVIYAKWDKTEIVADAAPSIATTSIAYTSGEALEIAVSLGAGDLAATGINRITYVNSSGTSTALGATNWSYADGKITIAESYITALAGSNITRDYKVTFDDDATTQVTITLHP